MLSFVLVDINLFFDIAEQDEIVKKDIDAFKNLLGWSARESNLWRQSSSWSAQIFFDISHPLFAQILLHSYPNMAGHFVEGHLLKLNSQNLETLSCRTGENMLSLNPWFREKIFKDSFRRQKAERKINKKELLKFQTSLFLALQEIYNPLFVYHGNWRTQIQWLKIWDCSCKTKIDQHLDNLLLSWSLI